MSDMVLKVRIRQSMTARIAMAAWLIRLAAVVMGTKADVEVDLAGKPADTD